MSERANTIYLVGVFARPDKAGYRGTHHLTTDPPNHVLVRGLAEAIAFGRSVTTWARSLDVLEETAQTWT
jgi:hypothetical protein